MSTVVIDYDQLSSIAKNADKAANRMNEYINDLNKKVSNKYSSFYIKIICRRKRNMHDNWRWENFYSGLGGYS